MRAAPLPVPLLSSVLLSLLLACSGGGAGDGSAGNGDGGGDQGTGPDASPTGDDGDGGLDALPYVGSVSMTRGVTHASAMVFDFASAYASFYDPYEYTGSPVPQPELDTCLRSQNTGGGQVPVIVYRDVGLQVNLGSGAGALILEQTNSNGILGYSPSESPLTPSRVQPASSYAVSWSGGSGMPAATLGANEGVVMPPALSLSSPADGATVAGALSVSWSGGIDGTRISNLNISGYDMSTQSVVSYFCRVSDDGSFTIPAQVIASLPSSTITLSLSRFLSRSVELSGEQVSLFGSFVYSTQLIKP